MKTEIYRWNKTVYAIFPHDEEGKIAGVYVGLSDRPETRIKAHLHDKTSQNGQKMLHELMRKNGYHWVVLSTLTSYTERFLEYDWVDYFMKKTDLTVFNDRTLLTADWHRVGGES